MAVLFYVEKEKKNFIDYFFLTFYEKEVSTLTVFLLFFLSVYITEASRKSNLTVWGEWCNLSFTKEVLIYQSFI